MTVTVQQLIDQARIRDARFFSLRVPDGALVLYLNTKQRTLLLKLGDAIEGLLGEAVEVAAVVAGSLVGVDEDGATYIVTTTGDGYPVQIDSDGVPYIDADFAPISLDPFGESGDTVGFPLPADIVKLIHVVIKDSSDRTRPVDVVAERTRASSPTRTPAAFINGNRLVPIRRGASPFVDSWNDVVSVAVSFVAVPTLSALDDAITLPVVLHEALIAGLASLLAGACPEMTAAEKRSFVTLSASTDEEILDNAQDMVGEVAQSQVVFRR